MTATTKQAVSFEIPFIHLDTIKLVISSDSGASLTSRFSIKEKGNYEKAKIFHEETNIT